MAGNYCIFKNILLFFYIWFCNIYIFVLYFFCFVLFRVVFTSVMVKMPVGDKCRDFYVEKHYHSFCFFTLMDF